MRGRKTWRQQSLWGGEKKKHLRLTSRWHFGSKNLFFFLQGTVKNGFEWHISNILLLRDQIETKTDIIVPRSLCACSGLLLVSKGSTTIHVLWPFLFFWSVLHWEVALQNAATMVRACNQGSHVQYMERGFCVVLLVKSSALQKTFCWIQGLSMEHVHKVLYYFHSIGYTVILKKKYIYIFKLN